MKAFSIFSILMAGAFLASAEEGAVFIYDLRPCNYTWREGNLILYCDARVEGETYGIVGFCFANDSPWRSTLENKIQDGSIEFSYFRAITAKAVERIGFFNPPRIDPVTSETIKEHQSLAEMIEEKNQKKEISDLVDFSQITQNEYLAVIPGISPAEEYKK